MKKIGFFGLLIFWLFCLGITVNGAMLSPAISVMQEDFEMIKTGVGTNTVSFGEEDFEALKMQVPFAAQVDNLLFKAENTGDRGSVTIVIDFATVETAQEVAEMLIGYKAMATGMLLPMAMGTPDSKTAAFVKKIRIASNEKQVTLSLAGSRDEVLGILKELQEVQQRQQAALKTKAADQEIVIDGLDELFDEEDDDVMTPEEAESILDSID